MDNLNDLISRDAAIAAFDDERVDRNYGDVSPESVIRVIESIPPVDAVPMVHARWVRSEDGDGIVCTACGEDYCDMVVGCNPKEWKFCPVCGAKMDGERRNKDE